MRLRITRLVDVFDYRSELSSAELVSITRKFIQQTEEFMKHALEDAHVHHSDVYEVVFLCGSTNFVSI